MGGMEFFLYFSLEGILTMNLITNESRNILSVFNQKLINIILKISFSLTIVIQITQKLNPSSPDIQPDKGVVNFTNAQTHNMLYINILPDQV